MASYTITASVQGNNGVLAPTGQVSVAAGQNQIFNITPNSGYQVSQVIVDGASVGQVTAYTFTNVQANHTIVVNFSPVAVYTGSYVEDLNPTIPQGTDAPDVIPGAFQEIKRCLLNSFAELLPAGVTVPFAGASAPTGWLFCYGQIISRATYPELFAVLGTTFGAGDGSTTFGLPDLRGCTIAGVDNMGGTAANRLTSSGSGITGTTLGATGGQETHVLTASEVQTHGHPVSVTDPGHGHSINDPGHQHTYGYTTKGVQSYAYGGTGFYFGDRPEWGSINQTNISINGNSTGITAVVPNPSGANTAHQNVQPTIVLNYIIKC